MASLEDDLRRVVGDRHLLTDAGSLAAVETDWTRRYRGRARALVRPGSTDEVAAVLRACGRHRVPVVPQGGNTGLVGGAVPSDAIVLSARRLDGIGPVDAPTRTVTVGAGATLGAVQRHVASAGLAVGIDLAARDSATIGGMMATDAGGIHTLRHGSMRKQVIAVEAVLVDGRVVRGGAEGRLGQPVGVSLAGSEGTLAVITEVTVRLVPAWAHRAAALLGLPDVGMAVHAVEHLRHAVPHLDAVEYLDRATVRLVTEHLGVAPPFEPVPPAMLLVDVAAADPVVDELAAGLERLPSIDDVVVGADVSSRRRLWTIRESATDAVARLGIAHKLDVRLPLPSLAAFVETLATAVMPVGPGARTFVWGHLAVGGLHVNIVGPDPRDETVDDAVLELVLAHGGSVAAEHGFGRAKTRWLHRERTAAELAAMAEARRAFDPARLLNPGVLEPD
jgi:FAD/FMN-containing dehydrogenase